MGPRLLAALQHDVTTLPPSQRVGAATVPMPHVNRVIFVNENKSVVGVEASMVQPHLY